MAMPPISVIIPSTRPGMLKEALRSVARQKYEGKMEIIIVVDPPEYAKFEDVISSNVDYKELEIMLIKTPRYRSGPSVARNVGIQKASYEIISFIDDDDLWIRGKLGLQLKYLVSYGLDVLLTSCINLFASNLYKRYPLTIKEKFKILEDKDIVVHGLGLTSTALARKSTVLENGGFKEDLQIGEDVELWLRILNNGGKIGFLNIPTVIRRIHERQITRRSIKTVYHSLSSLVKYLPYYGDVKDILASKLYTIGKDLIHLKELTYAEKILKYSFALGRINFRLRILPFIIFKNIIVSTRMLSLYNRAKRIKQVFTRQSAL